MNMNGRAVYLALLVGCEPVEPAPEDLDGAFHWLWTHYEEEDLAAVHDAIGNLGAAAGAESLAELDPVDGALTDITEDEIAVVQMRDAADPSVTAGMYLANTFPCTIERLEEIVIALDQMALYDGAYETYERSYTNDLEAYQVREAPILGWSSEITAETLGATYAETVRGESRWLPDGADGEPKAVLARYWMPEEATFDNPDFLFTQDYQLEIYWERGDGLLVHLYAMWRHMGFGGADTDYESIRCLILNNLGDWDDRTAELCAS